MKRLPSHARVGKDFGGFFGGDGDDGWWLSGPNLSRIKQDYAQQNKKSQ
jgi:hypothetical protein